ncbi:MULTISPECIES: AraC family transcriptional regulator [unclassified Janthinobacterium]|uniref:AraC family transcriptional regulator n=1 Tax=unclassified Janthinobacterium TaxID=2610881 RepID=UPI00161E7C64|nr:MULTISPECIES: AraC family transcriptional regulator [unclassified Janthinobacterium]MBB5369865.1 AraC-like DNA-binding protein [Janthinobacterium sp. K2C7]MBB5382671.1 AraC-like DNA-binding protein [Janthinobacterium sp. K2Li3]MBB5384656.1 AraC-like DNA-binding protein [Janthinobacterium sp. K2E3]
MPDYPIHYAPQEREQQRQRMASLLEQLAPNEGYNLTSLPGVRFLRSNRALKLVPVLYDPGIVIVCQGRKRGFFGGQTYVYDENHCLVVSVPVPFTMETDASLEEPLLAIYMHLDFKLAADLMLQLDQLGAAAPGKPQGMLSTAMDQRLNGSVLRFLAAMIEPTEAAILGPALVREIYFHILNSEQGPSMRAALAMQGQFGKVARALRQLHARYSENLTVEQLASEAGMSVPAFHVHFKSVTNTSPMQYLKSTRLHQARLLMVRNSITAAAASSEVGYDSPSQFSREFKRLFGNSPVEEVKRMRADFAVPPAHAASVFVSSH